MSRARTLLLGGAVLGGVGLWLMSNDAEAAEGRARRKAAPVIVPPARDLGLPVLDLMRAACSTRNWWFPKDDHDDDLFLFGIRDSTDAGTWNDCLGACMRVGGKWRSWLWRGTTDPGREVLLDPTNPSGAAILDEDQYRAMWSLGFHKHDPKRPAFVQTGRLRVVRDDNRDALLNVAGIGDGVTVQTGLYGINGHDAWKDGLLTVGHASEGCQVWWRRSELADALTLGRRQVATHPVWTSFTYTLLSVTTAPELRPLVLAVRA